MYLTRSTPNRALLALVFAGLLTAGPASAADTATLEAIDAAIAAGIRSDAERARDRNRRPRQTLEFFGLERDMRVIEIFPGGGWYAKILAPVLAEDGDYIAVGGLGEALGFGADLPGFEALPGVGEIRRVNIADALSPTAQRGVLNATDIDFGVREVDLVLTFRNLHNLTERGRQAMYEAAFEALGPGGRFGVIDHTRRHMQPTSPENWRRLDPVRVIHEVTQAGFRFIDYSDLHYRADDELRYEVGRRSVSGNTDRFTLLFEK